jgi:hypothetical protein
MVEHLSKSARLSSSSSTTRERERERKEEERNRRRRKGREGDREKKKSLPEFESYNCYLPAVPSCASVF